MDERPDSIHRAASLGPGVFRVAVEVFTALTQLSGVSGYPPRLPACLEILQRTTVMSEPSSTTEFAILQASFRLTSCVSTDVRGHEWAESVRLAPVCLPRVQACSLHLQA